MAPHFRLPLMPQLPSPTQVDHTPWEEDLESNLKPFSTPEPIFFTQLAISTQRIPNSQRPIHHERVSAPNAPCKILTIKARPWSPEEEETLINLLFTAYTEAVHDQRPYTSLSLSNDLAPFKRTPRELVDRLKHLSGLQFSCKGDAIDFSPTEFEYQFGTELYTRLHNRHDPAEIEALFAEFKPLEDLFGKRWPS